MEGKGDHDSYEFSYDIQLASGTETVSGLPAETKLLLVVLMDGDGEKGMCQPSSCILVSRSFFFQFPVSSEFAEAAKPHLVQQLQAESPQLGLTIIHCRSPRPTCLLYKAHGRVSWGCARNSHPYISQILDGGTDVSNPSNKQCCFGCIIFLDRGRSSGFHVALPL